MPLDQPSPSAASSKPEGATPAIGRAHADTETRSWIVAFLRALTLRCPRCGQGGLFRLWFRMIKQCPRCDLVFEQDEGSRLGSAMVNYAVVGAALVAYIVVGLVMTLPEPAVVPLVLGGMCVTIGVALVFFPFAKTIWAAIDLVLHGFESETSAPRS